MICPALSTLSKFAPRNTAPKSLVRLILEHVSKMAENTIFSSSLFTYLFHEPCVCD